MASYFNLTLDTTAPTSVSCSIDSGATYATQQAVTLGITSAAGDSTSMLIWGSVDTSVNANIQATEGASSWITFSTSQAVTLSSGDGSKTLNVKVRDDVGNVSSAASDTITLDTTVPVATVSIAASPTKISKVASYDTSTFSFQADVAVQAWKVKVVSATGSIHSSGTLIPTTAGSVDTSGTTLAATTNQAVTIKGTDLETASAGDGIKIVKVFVQDTAGNWST